MDVEAFRAARVLPHSASRRSMDAEAFRAAQKTTLQHIQNRTAHVETFAHEMKLADVGAERGATRRYL